MAVAGTMDFFGLQEQARRRTAVLIVLYALAVVGMIVAIYSVVRWLVGAGAEEAGAAPMWWQPRLLGAVAVGVLAVVASGTAFKTAQLAAHGGPGVAEHLGGRPVRPDTTDLAERRLLNVVEEMALAAGLPVPHVYVLDAERGINAFAAGFSPRDAAIGVTRGALDQLNRDELQGVIGHEFSHILYGDMRLNLRLIGVLHGIVLISLLGAALIRSLRYVRVSGGRRDRGSGGLVLVMLALGATLWLVGWIGAALASLIRAAVSRQREFLADAASAQFTRNPAGLASALRKIATASLHGRIATPAAPEAAHLFFADALGVSLDRLMATHPPIEERIRRLDPSAAWSLTPPPLRTATPAAPTRDRAEEEATVSALHVAAAGPARANSQTAVAAVGTVTPEGLGWVRALLKGIPASLLEAMREPAGARAVAFGLLLDHDPTIRHRQMEIIAADAEAVERLRTLRAQLESLPPESRRPLLQLAIPTLRRLPREEYERFRGRLLDLIRADQQVDLFEYALANMMERYLDPVFGRVDTAPQRYGKLQQVEREVRTVLAALAGWGNRERETKERAWRCALADLALEAEGPPPSVSLENVVRALDRLREAAPAVRRAVLSACARSVAEDERLDPVEADLLHAIADALDCPMPPLTLAEEPDTDGAGA